MGKPHKTKGAPFWYGESFRLDNVQKKRITEDILGIDTDEKIGKEKAKKAIILIERCLGAYKGAQQSVDQAPRAANYRAELEGTKKRKDGTNKDGLRRQAYDLMNDLSEMSYWMEEEFKAHGYDTNKLARELAKFVDAGTKISQKYDHKESRGASPQKALKMLVNTLRKVFEHYYSTSALDKDDPENDGRKRDGQVKAEILFIRECLGFVSIETPKTDDGIRDLFYKDSTPLEDRLYFKRG